LRLLIPRFFNYLDAILSCFVTVFSLMFSAVARMFSECSVMYTAAS